MENGNYKESLKVSSFGKLKMEKGREFKRRYKRFGFLLLAFEKRSNPNSHLRHLEGSNNRLISFL